MSGVLAPLTANPIGTPEPSVKTDRLVPDLARSVGFFPVFFSPQGRLGHAPIQALPLPVDAAELLIIEQPATP